MTVRIARALASLAVLPLLAACDASKSANPLSPSVAGPIAGVEISAPKPLEPVADSSLASDKQPVTLLIENASTTGQRPLSYRIEVAADPGFSTMVFSKDGVAPGGNGRTSIQVPDKLASDRTYFWRARAQDGANTGPFSGALKFSVFTPAVLNAPGPISPVGGTKVGSLNPDFSFHNASRSGAIGSITYMVEVSTDDSFAGRFATFTHGETGSAAGTTTVPSASPMPGSATIFWRVRAWDGTINGPWSTTQFFKTPAAPPPPTDGGGGDGGGGDGGGGGGGGTGGNGGSCASRDGDFIVNCISAKYASYRKAGVSSGQRKANMDFLRDRIIEAALCGGLDVGWNLKRGGPAISDDFITERTGGGVIGHDIAFDSDNTSTELELYWGSGTFPTYTKYTNSYTCN